MNYREALLDSIRFSDGQVYSLICKYEDDPTFDSVWCKSDVLGNANFSSRVKREVKRSKAKWFYIPNGDEVIEINSLAAFYNEERPYNAKSIDDLKEDALDEFLGSIFDTGNEGGIDILYGSKSELNDELSEYTSYDSLEDYVADNPKSLNGSLQNLKNKDRDYYVVVIDADDLDIYEDDHFGSQAQEHIVYEYLDIDLEMFIDKLYLPDL